MDTLLSPRYRAMVRQMLSVPFESAEAAAAEICELVGRTLEVDLVFASRIDGDTAALVGLADDCGSGLATGETLPAEQTLCRQVLAGRLPEVSGPTSWQEADLPWMQALGVRSWATSPLRAPDGNPTGTLAVLHREPRQFREEELALLDLLGGLLSREQVIAAAIERTAARTAQIEASDQRYKALVDDLGDIVVEIDAGGQISYVNPAWVALSGISAEHMVGKDMMEHVHPDDRAMAAEHMVEVLSGAAGIGAESAREVRFIAADGSLRWMSVRGRAMFDAAGELAGFLGILHDVTARAEAEHRVRAALEQAETALAEAERASQAKSEFLSRMSHELRTPLNAILGFGQLLELSELVDEDAENVEQIVRAGRHLLDLINEVLDVVRIESGALDLSLESVRIGEVLSESLSLVRTAASDRHIVLDAPDRLDRATVVADRQRLKQILVNLLSNAVKYNREHGRVTVGWSSCPAAEGADDAGRGWLRLAVRDTGAGIPADRLDDVFTPFDRLGAEATDIEGSGVGLSLTRTLVEAQGGRIGVTSEVGQGTTFWFELPAGELPPEEPPPLEDDPELTHTVLYIEDNPSNITLVRRVLARRPHVRLVVVQDGAEAVETAQDLVPDLVLLDLHLPGMHGAEVLSVLRSSEDDRLRKAPIVVVTADLTTGNERRMLEAGATHFLPKPIDIKALLAVVDEQLARS